MTFCASSLSLSLFGADELMGSYLRVRTSSTLSDAEFYHLQNIARILYVICHIKLQ